MKVTLIVEISDDKVRKIAKALDKTIVETRDLIREEYRIIASGSLDWQRLGISPKGHLALCHIDTVDLLKKEGWRFF